MSDLGTDLSIIDDLGDGRVTGFANLASALARRLETPRGGLFYDEDYGTDVREYLNDEIDGDTVFEMQALVAAECEKDPRVMAAEVEIEETADGIRVTALIETEEGPFEMVIAASKVTVEVLYANPR